MFEVEEVLTEGGGLVVLSLGFASPREPLDVLHIVSTDALTGCAEEDALYLERTDQGLACSGDEIVGIAGDATGITVTLTEAGAKRIGLGRITRFSFTGKPDLSKRALTRLAEIAAVGHPTIALS